jgi:hypothetical protein
MMDWTPVANALKDDAPLLAGLLAGNDATAQNTAAALVAHALGVAPNVDAVTAALKQPDATDKLKALENANSGLLQLMTLSASQSRESASVQMAKIAAADRANARATQSVLRDWVPKVLALSVTFAFFMTVMALVLGWGKSTEPDGIKQMLNVLVGTLGTAWVTIINFYFGTSAGSARKTEMLAGSVPVRGDSSLTLSETVGSGGNSSGTPTPPRNSNDATGGGGPGGAPLVPNGQGATYKGTT